MHSPWAELQWLEHGSRPGIGDLFALVVLNTGLIAYLGSARGIARMNVGVPGVASGRGRVGHSFADYRLELALAGIPGS